MALPPLNSKNKRSVTMGEAIPLAQELPAPAPATSDVVGLQGNSQAVTGDQRCQSCGYSLKGLKLGAKCPECGIGIAGDGRLGRASVIRLEHLPIDWLHSRRTGSLLVAGGFSGLFVSGVIAAAEATVLGLVVRGPVMLLVSVLTLASGFVLTVGGLILCKPHPAWVDYAQTRALFRGIGAWHVGLPLSALAILGGSVLHLYIRFLSPLAAPGPMVAGVWPGVLILLGISGLYGIARLFQLIAASAEMIGDVDLSYRTRVCVILGPVSALMLGAVPAAGAGTGVLKGGLCLFIGLSPLWIALLCGPAYVLKVLWGYFGVCQWAIANRQTLIEREERELERAQRAARAGQSAGHGSPL